MPSVLDKQKDECCGCGACVAVCPKKVLIMQPDEYGFIYPVLKLDQCINCGKCLSVCALENEHTGCIPQKAVGAIYKDIVKVKRSASGGVFQAIADQFLEVGGVVVGAAWHFSEDSWIVKHKIAHNTDELQPMLSSKYVQSDTEEIFELTQDYLNRGYKVLFSGTPCQVAQIKAFVRNNSALLYTIDVICHGIPSEQMWIDYTKLVERKEKSKIRAVSFREKDKGWGHSLSFLFEQVNGKTKKVYYPCILSSYDGMFLAGDNYRESCYNCRYASLHRVSDLTISDFWGVDQLPVNMLDRVTSMIDINKGVSCILINTDNGNTLLKVCQDKLLTFETSVDYVKAYNGQLSGAVKSTARHTRYMDIYKNKGYEVLHDVYLSELGIRKIYIYINEKIPRSLKIKIKQCLIRLKGRF